MPIMIIRVFLEIWVISVIAVIILICIVLLISAILVMWATSVTKVNLLMRIVSVTRAVIRNKRKAHSWRTEWEIVNERDISNEHNFDTNGNIRKKEIS